MVEIGHLPSWPLHRNPQAVKFVQPNILNRSGFSIGENDGFTDKLGLHLRERGQDGRCVKLHSHHGFRGERVAGE
jgi:hypothetical protein